MIIRLFRSIWRSFLSRVFLFPISPARLYSTLSNVWMARKGKLSVYTVIRKRLWNAYHFPPDFPIQMQWIKIKTAKPKIMDRKKRNSQYCVNAIQHSKWISEYMQEHKTQATNIHLGSLINPLGHVIWNDSNMNANY